MTGAFTKEQLEKLTQDLAEGLESVRTADSAVTYAPLDQRAKLRAQMQREIGAAGGDSRPRQLYPVIAKGIF